jgi:hypothetical protein
MPHFGGGFTDAKDFSDFLHRQAVIVLHSQQLAIRGFERFQRAVKTFPSFVALDGGERACGAVLELVDDGGEPWVGQLGFPGLFSVDGTPMALAVESVGIMQRCQTNR